MRGVIGVVVVVMGWVLPGVAAADDATCSYNVGNRTVTVTITPSDDFAPSLIQDMAGNLRISDAGQPTVSCGGTVTNTDTIVLNNGSLTQPLMTVFYIDGPFGPGFTDEPASSDEIELVANFGPGGTLGFSGPDPGVAVNIALGGNQINMNAGEADGVDADVTLNGVTGILVYLGTHEDRVIGSGGSGTPDEPVGVPMQVHGSTIGGPGETTSSSGGSSAISCSGTTGATRSTAAAETTSSSGDGSGIPPGDDVLTGGPGRDKIGADAGNDLVSGGPGNDRIDAGDGDDRAAGAGGRDTIVGGAGNDELRGQGRQDRLSGKRGDDLLDGGASVDRCSGGVGKDTLRRCEKGRA